MAISSETQHRKQGIVPFIIASIIPGSLLAVPVETIEFSGTKIATRQPRLRDVSIEIKSLGSQVKPEDLSFILVPAPHKGPISANGPPGTVRFRGDSGRLLARLRHRFSQSPHSVGDQIGRKGEP